MSKQTQSVHNRYRLIFFALIAVLYFAIPNARPDFTRFNAHDSESYLALSKNLLKGEGYSRSLADDVYIPHTLWPPGMPLVLMPAVWLSGETINWHYVKYTMVLIGLLGLLLTWLYLKRLFHNPLIADLTTLIVALNPFYWHFSHIAMAELPVIVWCIGALYLSDLFFKSGRICGWRCFGLGLLIGLGVMLKGVLLGLVFIPLGYLKLIKGRKIDFTALRQCLLFCVGFCLCFLSWSVRNSQIDRTNLGLDGVNQVQMMLKEVPEQPESAYRSLDQVMTTAKQNVFWYGIYHFPNQAIPLLWKLDLKSMKKGALIACGFSLLLLFLLIPRRKEQLPIFLLFSTMFLMMLLITIGGSERYWGPMSVIALLVIVPNAMMTLSQLKLTQASVFRAASGLVLLGLSGLSLGAYIDETEQAPYNPLNHWAELAAFFEQNRDLCVENRPLLLSSVYTMNEHAFTLMTGCTAKMTITAAGFVPKHSHAVLDLSQINQPIDSSKLLSKNSRWALVRLDKPLTSFEIESIYYSKQ